MQSIICFISDFGLDDTWVGVCHAVIHRSCPQAHVVDLAHCVPPYDVRKGAAVAASGVHQIPDAIHLVVVDPGVGAGRRDICIRTAEGSWLVGPDNGVLVPAAMRAGGIECAIAIDPAKIDLRSPLATFHARDILAPAAAALACGVEASSLGVTVDAGTLAPAPFEMCRMGDGEVIGEVLEADRFGSIRFNVPAEQMDRLGLRAASLAFALGHNQVQAPLAVTYADVRTGDPVALIDSSGWLTLALNRASAVERFGIEDGTAVRIRAVSEDVRA